MISVRGGAGLGDAIYIQAIARHLLKSGPVEVCCDWPEVFRFLPVKMSKFRRDRITNLAHYSARKGIVGTTQFQDCCAAAGVPEVALTLDWKPTSDIAASIPRPFVCLQLPRAPMGRKDGFGAELLPDCNAIQRAVNAIKGRATVVQIGSGKPLFRFEGIDIDLANKTTVSQLFDVAQQAQGFIGYVSFFVPLAEAFDKRGLSVWSRRGLKAGHEYVRRITPEKVLHKPTSQFVMDDAKEDEIHRAVDALF